MCGVGFVLAEAINGLFFRNAVNYGLLACECPGLRARADRRGTNYVPTTGVYDVEGPTGNEKNGKNDDSSKP